jgi:arsenite methyltransferase
VLLEEYRAMIEGAGFVDIELQTKPEHIAALGQSGDPLYRRIAEALPPGTTAADFATSVDVTAMKPS